MDFEEVRKRIPPDSSLKKEIEEIISKCEWYAPDYGDNASWFNPPATEAEISEWEKNNEVTIPESYKEWLRFSNGSQIINHKAKFAGLDQIDVKNKNPDGLVCIGSMIGDGERICFSKENGNVVRLFENKISEFDSFKLILMQIIRFIR